MSPPDARDRHDRLLEGEDPTTLNPVAASRWVRVYSDLIRAKDSLITDLQASRGRSAPEARSELEERDGRFFLAERQRYERRLAFWERRRRHLVESAR